MSTEVSWPYGALYAPGEAIFVQGGEDTIYVQKIPHPDPAGVNQGMVGIGLQTVNTITWRKQIRILDSSGNELNSVATQDNEHGPLATMMS
jgi:hypothetical protein